MTRSRQKRKSNKITYIFVEGETEGRYFNTLRQKERWGSVNVIQMNNTGKTWVEKVKKQFQNDPKIRRTQKNCIVYIVFDRDLFDKKEYSTLAKSASAENYQLISSYSTFEVWLLAHYESVTKGILDPRMIESILSRHLGEKYKKANQKQIDKMIEFVDDAIDNSKNVNRLCFESQYTEVAKMIEDIRGS